MWSLMHTTYTDRQGLVIETIAVTVPQVAFIHVEAHLGCACITVSFAGNGA